MKKNSLKAFKMPFREPQRDEEGNVILDKKTGDPIMTTVKRIVRYNPAYFPKIK